MNGEEIKTKYFRWIKCSDRTPTASDVPFLGMLLDRNSLSPTYCVEERLLLKWDWFKDIGKHFVFFAWMPLKESVMFQLTKEDLEYIDEKIEESYKLVPQGGGIKL